MASYSDIQHRFANKLAGKRGCISASSCRYEGRNFYSYSTVFGQWADVEKNVCIVFDGSTSMSSSKHRLGKWYFPDNVHVFPYNDNRGGWYSYSGCDLMGWTDKFTFNHRCILIDHYVERIYNQLAAIKDGKKKGLENVDFTPWNYIEELCSLYKDTSINKYLKAKSGKSDSNSEEIKKHKRKLVKLLKEGERNVETITDAMFGEGTFKKYYDYCGRYRKSDGKRAQMEWLCLRLGIGSPYVEWRGYSNLMPHEMSAADIRKLTAKERNEIHFRALAYKELKDGEDERKKSYNKRKDNAYKWVCGFEPIIDSTYSHSYKYCSDVRNMYTGEVYECGGDYIYGFYWCDTHVSFEFDNFRQSEDKEQWISDFYAECKEVVLNRKAIEILRRVNANTKEKAHIYDDDVYLNDDYLRENTTEAEYIICSEFIRKQDKHFADEEARRRAAEIARLQREEEERKEKEYLAQVKQEQIDELSEHGIEGVREIWRRHYMSIEEVKRETYGMDGDLFSGGNVLLRLNLSKDKVETSKSIRIPVEVCKKMWEIVSKWHENPKCFKPMQIDTKGSGTYTISSYENDILTAGCHDIAYVEMERMYNEIINA